MRGPGYLGGNPMSIPSRNLETVPVTINHVHWHATVLLDVPPVQLATEYEPSRIRQRIATYIDGRLINDALYRAVIAIRHEFGLEPYAYVVVFPQEGFEIPIDLRAISDDPARLVGFVKEPRGMREVVFDYAQLDGKVADSLAGASRDQSLSVMKQLSSDGQEFTLDDRCSHDERFAHRFEDGAYYHNFRYVATRLPEAER